MQATQNRLRRVIFRPYAKGQGPVFILDTFYTGQTDHMGKDRIRYRLAMRQGRRTAPIFDASDFCCSPLYAIDSDECIEGLMGFLTVRPGDTDDEYFRGYTPEQLAFCSEHAEALGCEAMNRFGDN